MTLETEKPPDIFRRLFRLVRPQEGCFFELQGFRQNQERVARPSNVESSGTPASTGVPLGS